MKAIRNPGELAKKQGGTQKCVLVTRCVDVTSGRAIVE